MIDFRTNGNFIDIVNIDNTSLAVESLLMSLHTTSNCITWGFSNTTNINITIDDVVFDNYPATDILFDGVALTEAADFPTAIRAVFTGLSSGSGYLVAEVTLTDAQIKALPTTPVEIVVAPGVGNTIKIINAFIVLNTTAGAYGGVTDASFSLASESGGGFFLSSPMIMDGVLNNAGINIENFICPYGYVGAGSFASVNVTGGNPIPLSHYENKPILLLDEYASGGIPYTGGNPANTLKLIIYYVVVDL